MEWAIVLTVPPELGVTGVRFGEETLTEENGEYRVPRFWGAITLAAEDGESKEVPLFDGAEPLIFRLSGSGDTTAGRQCRRIANGHFLVIAPSGWSIDYRVILEDEPCTDGAFRAHHIYPLRTDTSGDLGSIGSFRLGADRSASLTGERVVDSSDDGELFVRESPQLASTEGIEWARVGEERPGGWKGRNFRTHKQTLGQALGPRRGCFFLRTYEPGKLHLADSITFRYWPDLQEIRVNEIPLDECDLAVPSDDGHERASVRLVGRNGSVIPEVRSKHARLDRGSVIVEPTPAADQVCLLLRDPHSAEEMNVAVNLPRVWWRVGGNSDWTDRPIPMPRRKFRTSTENLEILVPSGIELPTVGLEEAEDSALSLQASDAHGLPGKRQASIRLDSFADAEVLEEPREKNLALRVRFPEGSATVVEVVPDRANPPPAEESVASSRLFRGSIVRRKVFRGVVLESNMDGFVRVVWGKKRHTRVIQNLLPVPCTHGTIPGRVTGIFWRTKVVLHPAPAGTGLSAPQPVKAILELCGVRDVCAVTSGARDHLSLIKATLDGLTRLEAEATTHVPHQREKQ